MVLSHLVYSNLKIHAGKFDLIQCSGVLHHLPDPQYGLNILSNFLAPGGGMALMVYARYTFLHL